MLKPKDWLWGKEIVLINIHFVRLRRGLGHLYWYFKSATYDITHICKLKGKFVDRATYQSQYQ